MGAHTHLKPVKGADNGSDTKPLRSLVDEGWRGAEDSALRCVTQFEDRPVERWPVERWASGPARTAVWIGLALGAWGVVYILASAVFAYFG